MKRSDTKRYILIAAACICFGGLGACSDNVSKDYDSFEALCKASGGTYNSVCECSGVKCDGGVICIDGVCANHLCSMENDTKCEDGYPFVCIKDGKHNVWSKGEIPCFYGYCKANNKVCAECAKSDANTCADGKICVLGQLVDCTNSSCTEDGKYSCLNDSVRVPCRNKELNYKESEACKADEVCKDGVCGPNNAAVNTGDYHNTCQSGALICDNVNTVKKCENGTWKSEPCGDGTECRNVDGCVPKDIYAMMVRNYVLTTVSINYAPMAFGQVN